MREEFEKILEKNGIYGEDLEDILYAVQDMIDFVLEKTKENEPYAKNSIQNLETASREISFLMLDI